MKKCTYERFNTLVISHRYVPFYFRKLLRHFQGLQDASDVKPELLY